MVACGQVVVDAEADLKEMGREEQLPGPFCCGKQQNCFKTRFMKESMKYPD